MFRLPTARADGGTAQFSLRPVSSTPGNSASASYFIFGGQPGVTISNKVRVTNTGTVRGSADLYAVDATTGQTSGAVYLSRTAPKQDVGAWVTLSVAQVTLSPGQSQTVAFQVAVPQAVRPGQHLGGIVAENTALQQASNGGSVQINIQQLSIVAVQVNLPGTLVDQLTAQHVTPGGEHNYQVLYVGLRNSGTQMLKPSGTLQIADSGGHTLKTMQLTLDTFVPQTSIDYPVYVSGQALGVGQYQATLTLQYGTGKVLHYTTNFAITQDNLQQVFGSHAPSTPPLAVTGVSLLGIGLGAFGVLLLGLLGGMVFVPRLRARLAHPTH
jgi:hypothetical protein